MANYSLIYDSSVGTIASRVLPLRVPGSWCLPGRIDALGIARRHSSKSERRVHPYPVPYFETCIRHVRNFTASVRRLIDLRSRFLGEFLKRESPMSVVERFDVSSLGLIWVSLVCTLVFLRMQEAHYS